MRQFPFLLICLAAASAAEPDWQRVESTAIDLLQKYIRIASVNPPGDTRAAADLYRTVLEANGFPVRLFPSGPNGQVNLLTRLPGRDRTLKPLLLLNHFDVVPVDRKAWRM